MYVSCNWRDSEESISANGLMQALLTEFGRARRNWTSAYPFRAALLSGLLLIGPCGFGQRAFAEEETLDAVATKNAVALPEQIDVVKPDENVPAELAAFSGAWSGDAWNGIIPTALVVEKMDEAGAAKVIFAWGDIEQPRRKRGWLRLDASFDHGTLTFSIPEHGRLEYSLAAGGRLFARYIYPNGRRSYALLNRIDPADRSAVVFASRSRLSPKMLTFPLVSTSAIEGATQLKGAYYRSPVAGRQSLVIFSGDSVAAEKLRDHPNLAPIRSRQVLSLGYSMLVLQRKGMGGSGGIFMEPRDETVSQSGQLQSALDDLDSAVTFMRRRDDVNASRIVLMGVFRGGLLSVAYAGLHDGAVAGVINQGGIWSVRRSWWRQKLTWQDFTATQMVNAGKRTKLPMLWIYGSKGASVVEYARNNYRGFTYQGGRGTFVDVLAQHKPGSPENLTMETEENAIDRYIRGLN